MPTPFLHMASLTFLPRQMTDTFVRRRQMESLMIIDPRKPCNPNPRDSGGAR